MVFLLDFKQFRIESLIIYRFYEKQFIYVSFKFENSKIFQILVNFACFLSFL